MILGLALGGLVVTEVAAHRQLQRRAAADVRSQALLITGVVTDGELPLPVPVPAATRARMHDRLEDLRTRGAVLGFQLWTSTGEPVFSYSADRAGVAAGSRADAIAGRDKVSLNVDHGVVRSDDVLTHPRMENGQPDDVVAVLSLRTTELDSVRTAAQTWILAGSVVLIVVLAGGLLLVRRQTRHRAHEARHDHLTGLGNRMFLAEAARTRRHHAYGLLLLDLDGFKDVNDTLGHAAGDELLVQVAAALRSSVRRGDLVMRVGGDEFAILLDGVDTPDLAMQVAGQVRQGLAQAGFTVRDITLDVLASIGVAVHPADGLEVESLLRQADVAMYRAKASGRGAVLYTAADDHHDTDKLALLGELRHAIANDELTLHYQPIVSASRASENQVGPDDERRTPDVVSVEALVRWEHPQRGLLGPNLFIPTAEHTGIIHALTEWVLERAIGQAASWRRSGLELTVSVNLSPRAINDGLLTQVMSILDQHDLPASQLKLEITETAIADDPARTIAILRTLRAAGIQISLDDFGAGYTSLAYLTALPLTELKIDLSFVQHVTDSDEKAAVVSAVIALGHRLGLSIVAEGVETAETDRAITALGCDAIQGYLYSKPLRPDQLEGWLAATRVTVGTRS